MLISPVRLALCRGCINRNVQSGRRNVSSRCFPVQQPFNLNLGFSLVPVLSCISATTIFGSQSVCWNLLEAALTLTDSQILLLCCNWVTLWFPRSRCFFSPSLTLANKDIVSHTFSKASAPPLPSPKIFLLLVQVTAVMDRVDSPRRTNSWAVTLWIWSHSSSELNVTAPVSLWLHRPAWPRTVSWCAWRRNAVKLLSCNFPHLT